MSLMVTKGSDYALLLLSDMARRPESEIHSIHEMAERNHLPERFIANIVSKLIRAGILSSKRGFNGGIQLARESWAISFREVIEAIEGPIVLMDCQRGPNLCDHEVGCSMKGLWEEIRRTMLNCLEKTTIGEVLNRGSRRGEEAREPERVLKVLDELPVPFCWERTLGAGREESRRT